MLSLRTLLSIVLSIAVTVVVILFISGQENFKAQAGSGDNVSGFAWSDTIGWISMNSTSDGSPINYGVNVQVGGDLSGYAWSDNIGWISFNATDVATCPSAPCTPHLNQATGKVTGWAKALAGGGLNAGGWDGFISLSGATYGVTVSGCTWSGWAWGDMVVGWVNFGGNGGAVMGSGSSCAALSGNAITASDCIITAGNNSCNTNVMWNSVGFATTRVLKGGTQISTSPTTGAVPVAESISYNGGNPTLFELYDGSVQKATASATATCTPGTKWNATSNACSLPSVTFEACDSSGTNCVSAPTSKDVLTSVPLQLRWTSNADTCTPVAGPGFVTGGTANGTDPITSNATQNTSDIFTILCQFAGAPGAVGTIKSVTVNAQAPTPDLTADPRVVRTSPGTTKLTWDLKGQTGCTLVGGSLNRVVNVNDSDPSVTVTGKTTFTLTCGGQSDSVIVEIVPKGYET